LVGWSAGLDAFRTVWKLHFPQSQTEPQLSQTVVRWRSSNRQRFCKQGGFMTSRVTAAVLCALALFASGMVWAQGLTGSLVGTVRDPANAVVPRAKITVKNASTNAETQSTTDDNWDAAKSEVSVAPRVERLTRIS